MMDKRGYDKAYQARNTRVIQVRLNVEKDADILRVLEDDKAGGRSFGQCVKRYMRLGIQYEGRHPLRGDLKNREFESLLRDLKSCADDE